MSVRRNSKIFAEIPEENNNMFLGQAPPGSQRMPRAGSSASMSAGIEAARNDEGQKHSVEVPRYMETNQAPLSRKKSAASIAAGDHSADSSSGLFGSSDHSGIAKGGKVRRKSNAALTIATGGSVVDLRPDAPEAPLSSKATRTPKGGKPVVMIKDSTKRASSRLMIEKQKSVRNNARNGRPDDAEEIDDRKNSIDCDTCCIFIF